MDLRVPEAAARLGISVSYAYELTRIGELPFSEVEVGIVGKVRVIPAVAVEALKARRLGTGGEAA